MRLGRAERDVPDINLTPLIDVVFLLLIFFMVSTTFEQDSQLSIELPEATSQPSEEEPQAVEIAIDAKGRYFVNGRQLVNTQTKTIRQAMSKEAGDQESPLIVISADAQTPHQAVIAVMDAARQLGFMRLSFAYRLATEEEQ